MRPIYTESLVVGIKMNKVFQWCIFDTEWCYLDTVKQRQKFLECGYDVTIDTNFRFGIDILNEDSIQAFLEKASEYVITTQELKRQYFESQDIDSYAPAVFMDFDSKILRNFYIECQPFEFYVPDNWTGIYENFLDYIPASERFWVDD